MMLKKLVIVSLVITSFNLFASEARPGLWEVKMQLSQNGKEVDPMAELMKEMDKLPDEHKKMILEQIKKNSNMKHGLTKTCYTKEMLKKPSEIATQEDQDCTYVEKTHTAKRVVATFKCADGSSGTSVWELKDSRNMKVVLDFKSKEGGPGKMVYTAKFLQDKCE